MYQILAHKLLVDNNRSKKQSNERLFQEEILQILYPLEEGLPSSLPSSLGPVWAGLIGVGEPFSLL